MALLREICEVHGHTVSIIMYAAHMRSVCGCAIYKLQRDWYIRHVHSELLPCNDRSCASVAVDPSYAPGHLAFTRSRDGGRPLLPIAAVLALCAAVTNGYSCTTFCLILIVLISVLNMASVASGLLAAGGPPMSQRSLPLDELNILFVKFLEQQSYDVPSEGENIIHATVSKANSRDSSSYLSVSSSVKRKSKKVTRRLCKSSGSDANDPSMEVEINHEKLVIQRDSPTFPALFVIKMTAAVPKQTTIRVKNFLAIGTKPSLHQLTLAISPSRI
ncbi:hypothetical protein EVAR_30590_1 [Eumeta japonica]|uniref:Uncharacterized protein n=1 Tax=Eumeta variegata TaxID=151549 RepID=A0A4C1WAG1_EUMVA|nr:hypothetical protein EVAR_30590_1 [Eumeta japonica]